MNTLTNIFLVLPKNFKKNFNKIIILLFLVSILEITSVALIVPIITLVINENSFSILFLLNNYTDYFNDYLFLSSKNFNLFFLTSFYLIFYILRSAFIFFVRKKEIIFTANLNNYLQEKFINGYINQEQKILDKFSTDKYLEVLINQITLFSNNVRSVFSLYVEILTISFLVVFLLFYNPFITLISMFFFILITLPFYYYLQKKIKYVGLLRDAAQKKIFEYSNSIIRNIFEIKIFGIKKRFLDGFLSGLRENKDSFVISQSLLVMPRLLLEVASLSLFVLLVCYFVIYSDSSTLIITLSIYAFVILKAFPSISKITNCMSQIKYLDVVVKQLSFELKSFSKIKFENRSNLKRANFNNSIELKNLTIGYGNSNILLDKVNIKIAKHDFIGICGSSGSGKSTFVNILLGILQPLKGTILVDHKLQNLQDRSWRNLIGYAPQSINIFKATIAENVAFGHNLNEINFKDLDKAIKLASLDDFIDNLEKGLKTIINEDGKNISGGQIQRMGLARALYYNPDILILDEFTSSLDENTEVKILNSLIKLRDKYTIILISHKLSALKICNKIYEIREKNMKLVN